MVVLESTGKVGLEAGERLRGVSDKVPTEPLVADAVL
jgi:hypothetical protein